MWSCFQSKSRGLLLRAIVPAACNTSKVAREMGGEDLCRTTTFPHTDAVDMVSEQVQRGRRR